MPQYKSRQADKSTFANCKRVPLWQGVRRELPVEDLREINEETHATMRSSIDIAQSNGATPAHLDAVACMLGRERDSMRRKWKW